MCCCFSDNSPHCSEQVFFDNDSRGNNTSDDGKPVSQLQGSTGSAGLITEGSAIISKCNNDLQAGLDQPGQVEPRMPSASDSDMQCRQISEQDELVTPVASDEQGVEQNDPKSLCDNHKQFESDFEHSRQELVRLFAPFCGTQSAPCT